MIEQTIRFSLLQFRYVAGLFLVYGVLAPVSFAETVDIRDWITDLDAKAFAKRESATESLIVAGKPALQPVALHFYKATPEAAWRIKRILQAIGTNSAEEITSLKAIGLLLLLDNQLDGELETMLETWRENRSQRAIKYLVSKGALTAPTGIHRQLFVPAPNVVMPRRLQIEANNNPLRKDLASRKLSVSESKSKIKKLVDGDLDEVQEFVFGNLQRSPQQEANEKLLEDLFIVQANARGMGLANRRQTYLEIGQDWKGDANDLEKLREIHTLNALRFVNAKLDQDSASLIADLSNLQHMGFCNTQIRGGHVFDLNLPTNVNSLELKEQNIESETIDWLAENDLTSLIIEDCEFPAVAQEQITDITNLEVLSLKKVKLSDDIFESLAKMPNVKRIYLSICKFAPDNYRQFNRIRPRVIVFNPVSFLGVQGKQTRRGDFSCQIEMVVAGSAAERAGIQPGDNIESVNGERVSTFEELRMFISQMDVDEEMKMIVTRGDQEIELTARLGANDGRQ